MEKNEQSEKHKELIRNFFDEIYNKGNNQLTQQLVVSTYISRNKLYFEVLGPERIEKAVQTQ